ncbi:hypothetical protein GJ496_001018 [Pomphorhynchus laevis]|nr:hypothetical protein GJ496_001018 [Pomphorhynchus laevis]
MSRQYLLGIFLRQLATSSQTTNTVPKALFLKKLKEFFNSGKQNTLTPEYQRRLDDEIRTIEKRYLALNEQPGSLNTLPKMQFDEPVFSAFDQDETLTEKDKKSQ